MFSVRVTQYVLEVKWLGRALFSSVHCKRKIVFDEKQISS